MLENNQRRSINLQSITPVLKQKTLQESELYRRRAESREAAIRKIQSEPDAIAEAVANQNIVAFSPSRQVFSSHTNKDLVSLSERELNAVLEGRPPRSGVPRQTPAMKKEQAINRRKKKQAIQSLLQDRAMTTELIRLYSNNAELKES